MANQLDFSIDRGTTATLTFVYSNADGTPINITNYCSRLTMVPTDGTIGQKTYFSGSSDVNYSCSIDGSNGIITLILSSVHTSAFDFTSARYDLDLKIPNSPYNGGGDNIVRIYQGFIRMIASASNSPETFSCPTPPDPCITC